MTTHASHAAGHLVLVDGSSFLFRAYHALPPLSRPDGTPVGAVLGFCNMLYKLLEDQKEQDEASHFAVIFDAARRTFRNEIYPEYKAHRPEPPEDLIPQFDLVREASKAFNLATIELPGYEADDVIATLATRAETAGMRISIVSTDKDLMQLVTDKIMLVDTMKNKLIDAEGVQEKFGLGPAHVIDIQALAGDSVDNVPGVPGIGVKTAAQLIEEYGDLETLLERAEEIKQPKRRQNLIEYADLARTSKELVTLKTDVPLDLGLEDLQVREIDPETVFAFIDKNNFKSLRAKLVQALEAPDHVTDADVPAAPADSRYTAVTKMKDLHTWIDRAQSAGIVALDTETTGLNAMRADLVGLSLSVMPGEACYIPVGHTGSGGEGSLDLDGDVPEQLDCEAVLQALKPLLEDPGVLKVLQNAKYDLLILKRYGITVTPIDDTMLLSYVLDSGLHKHGMDELSELHLAHTPISFKDLAGSGKNQKTFDQIPLKEATDYAAEDADITLRLYQILKPQLTEKHKVQVYESLERPMPQVLVGMEHAGIKVDRDMLKTLSTEFETGIEALANEIYTLAGHEFNIGSPKQLGEVLFDEIGLESGKKGKSGARSTNVDVLEKLANEGHEIARKVLDWRQFSKLKSTYTDTLQNDIHPETGRVHTSYALASTSTGRLSSNDPNLQNIPIRTPEGRRIREAFIAEQGYKLVSADYSQIELRILAHMANIAMLKQAFAKGQDIHAMTASEVFGIPMEGMDPADRRKAKAINFGIIYGISAFGLANNLGIPQADAKAYIARYFERFPGIRTYMDTTIEQAREQGYVETLFGRRCHMRGIRDKNPQMRNFAERAAINAPIQGSAADIIRRAMIRMPAALEAEGLAAKMLLQVHDELIFEVPEGEVEDTITLVKRVMQSACQPVLQLDVPLDVDAGIGDTWDQAH